MNPKGLKPKVFTNDCNAWATEWKGQLARGSYLFETFVQFDNIFANDIQVNSYWKSGSGSTMDLNFISPSIVRKTSWNISPHYNHSDHHALVFDLKNKSSGRRSVRLRMRKTKVIDEEKFMNMWLDQGTIPGTSLEAAFPHDEIQLIDNGTLDFLEQ